MATTLGWWIAGSAFGGMLVGAMLCLWKIRHTAKKNKRIPRHWPLNPRGLLNSEERKVWLWLSRVFFDHHVMIKIPVTRFTIPESRKTGLHWYNLLSGVYCTFTICTTDGIVVGCVDVPGPKGISRSNRQLKLTLLPQCGIGYRVVKPSDPPTVAEIRLEFLGESATAARELQRKRDQDRIAAARAKLHSEIDRQRHSRQSDFSGNSSAFSQDSIASLDSQMRPDSDFAGEWQEQNSFISPLDSRSGDLR